MSTLSIDIPNSVRTRVELLAEADGVSVDVFVSSILSQRIAVADVDSYMQRRAQRGSVNQMLEILSKAPESEPESSDKLG